MRTLLIGLVLAAGTAGAAAPPPPQAGTFAAGIFADPERTVACVAGPPGTAFVQHFWAWVPGTDGLAYVTLRCAFPPTLDRSARPALHDLVTDLIITDYADGSEEWNFLFLDCPAGWIEVCTQTCVITDAEPAAIRIAAEHSMLRDCGFVLNDIQVLGGLGINDPQCEPTAAPTAGWGTIKGWFR